MKNEWPPERVAKLTRLFNKGVSYEQIAGMMALTRNAVIGKCDRLGLKRDISPTKKAAAKTGHLMRKLRCGPAKNKKLNRIIAGPKLHPDPLPPPHPDDLAIPARRRKQIATLGPRDCKFPVGDPGTPSFFFCGARKLDLLPYCAEHAARCYWNRS